MLKDPDVIKWLNRALKAELTAINQYFLHSRMLRDWGVSLLAKKEYEESIEEMNHADEIIERIFLFQKLPVFVPSASHHLTSPDVSYGKNKTPIKQTQARRTKPWVNDHTIGTISIEQ